VNNQLARFEKIAERLVEGSLARLFAGQLHPQEIVAQLARAMEDNAHNGVAPDHYYVYLSPADHRAVLQAEPTLPGILAEHVLILVRQAGLELDRAPVVEMIAQRGAGRQTVAVTASTSQQETSKTQAFDSTRFRRRLDQQPDGSTYLIVEGRQHLALTKPVYTLGRRLDCDVVISDLRVSRQHAQLRWRFGRYVLYDLGSTAGTMVNGHYITEAVLEPGDVFSLGGVDVIYGRDGEDDQLSADADTTRSWTRPIPTLDQPSDSK